LTCDFAEVFGEIIFWWGANGPELKPLNRFVGLPRAEARCYSGEAEAEQTAHRYSGKAKAEQTAQRYSGEAKREQFPSE